jgi:H+/gluconate symporter-like permease
MKAFVAACVVAIIIAVVGGIALKSVPDSAERAFSSPTGVSLTG